MAASWGSPRREGTAGRHPRSHTQTGGGGSQRPLSSCRKRFVLYQLVRHRAPDSFGSGAGLPPDVMGSILIEETRPLPPPQPLVRTCAVVATVSQCAGRNPTQEQGGGKLPFLQLPSDGNRNSEAQGQGGEKGTKETGPGAPSTLLPPPPSQLMALTSGREDLGIFSFS